MGTDIKIIQELHDLSRAMHEETVAYYHSRPLVTADSGIVIKGNGMGAIHGFTYQLGLKEIILAGAITESPVLLTGGTDIGKTTLSRLVLSSLFGKEDGAEEEGTTEAEGAGKHGGARNLGLAKKGGWHRMNMDLDFNQDAYTKINIGALHRENSTNSDLYQAPFWAQMPALFVDELNRAPAKLSNKMLHILMEKSIELPDGRKVALGCTIPGDGQTYQFQIAAINEGEEYGGTFEIDSALRRRATIEIPMDMFPLTSYDRLQLQESDRQGEAMPGNASRLEAILRIHGVGMALPIHEDALLFLSYLGAFGYCRNSLTGEKGSVDSRNGSIHHICQQAPNLTGFENTPAVKCRFLKSFDMDLCPHVRGITPGITKNVIQVSKGLAMLRATKFVELLAGNLEGITSAPLSYSLSEPDRFESSLQAYTGSSARGAELAQQSASRYITELEVNIEDIEAAIGFVALSKIGIAWPWVKQFYQGNMYEAVRFFVKSAKDKFREGMSHEGPTINAVLNGNSNPGQQASLSDPGGYCKKDNPWLYEALRPFIENSGRHCPGSDKLDMIYGK